RRRGIRLEGAGGPCRAGTRANRGCGCAQRNESSWAGGSMSTSPQALYRRWRPRRFGDVVGQDHVTRTLRNAVKTGRVAHGYLFCGPRGVAKTSTARILAKAINCLDPQDGEPCDKCELCRAIADGTCYDVIEMDA